MSCILAVDSGNTMIKWGVYRDGWLLQAQVMNIDSSSLSSAWSALPQPTSIIVSHVSTLQIRKQLSKCLSVWPVQVIWINSVFEQCGVSNRYKDPAQLGSDRWASLIGAWAIQKKACLVINIGTAVTIDMLSSSGDFLGGIILPGPNLMMQRLDEKAALINIEGEAGSFEVFPTDTISAIYSGVIHALLGAIDRMQAVLLSRITERSHLGENIISGGGAPLLLPHLGATVKHVNNLVLEGLVIMASDALQK